MLRAEHVYKRFGELSVLRDVNAHVAQGEVVAIIGPSGGGKSTFLRCLNHLEEIDSGCIALGNESFVQNDAEGRARYAPEHEVRRICRRMGLVFQSFHLFPHFSVLRNLTEAQTLVLGTPRAQAREKAMVLLSKVGLEDKAAQYPYQLSGGQCQRVAIARALAMDPAILCFDEPTSALDPRLTQEVLSVMRALAEEKRTMLVVTHEMPFAREVADRVLVMMEGCVVEEGTPDEVLQGAGSSATRAFLGE